MTSNKTEPLPDDTRSPLRKLLDENQISPLEREAQRMVRQAYIDQMKQSPMMKAHLEMIEKGLKEGQSLTDFSFGRH
jgi:uncharacterized protein YnzC (UPF0291/DUF896 family)